MTDEILYTWVHLSDIHFGHGSPAWREDQADVVDKLVEDIPEALALAGVDKPDAVLLTGDIAFAGRADEFAYARGMLARISKRLGTEPLVFAVAGNHDVIRTPPSELSTMRLLDHLRGGGDVDQSLAHPPDAAMLDARFAAYREFCDAVGSPVSVTDGWVETIDLGHFKLRFVGWNTGLLCNDNNERGALAVSLASAIRSLRGRDSNEIVVVLTHHSLDWLQEAIRNKLRGRMWTKDANVHLSGHEHNPNFVAQQNARGGRMIDISAGAVHADEDRGWAQTEFFYSVATVVSTQIGGVLLKVYPRRFSLKTYTWVPDTESAPHGEPCATFILVDSTGPTAVPTTGSSGKGAAGASGSAISGGAGDGLRTESQTSTRRLFAERLRQLGRRRTTFPTDLSTAQVVQMDLVVPARTRAGERVLDVLAGTGDGTESTLVLGDPGAGKTVLAYTMARKWLDEGRLPLAVDLRDLGDLDDVPTTLSLFLDANFGIDTFLGDPADLRFIVDGLDEALGAGLGPAEVHTRITTLQRFAPVVALCRRREFSTRLGTWLSDDFDAVIDLAEWSQAEFTEYLERLVQADQIPDTSLGALVDHDPRLMALVTRPLLARMLTLVASSTDRGLPTDIPTLYNAYLTRLAESADATLRRITGTHGAVAMDVWRRVAWAMFLNHDRGVDAFTPEQVLAAATAEGVDSDVAFRAIEAIMDVDPSGDTVSFLHYSLFEFLVAQTIADRLTELATTDPAAAATVLSKDLTHEIRGYVVGLLLGATSLNLNRWPEHLASVYRAGRELDPPASLTACNLVVYILSRLGISAEDALLSLLQDEDNLFLRNSVQWALARQDHRPSADHYIADLVSDSAAASLNRGYLLYYYGDIDEHAGPPYPDTLGPWRNTRDKVAAKLSDAAYSNVSPARRLVDVFTFCDTALAREERLSAEEVDLLAGVLDTIPDDAALVDALAAVQDRLEQVRS